MTTSDWEVVQQLSKHHYSSDSSTGSFYFHTRREGGTSDPSRPWSENRHAGLVFSPTIVHARHFAAVLRNVGFTAECLSNETPARDREVTLSRFKAGQIDFLTTVDLFNEGVDVPDVDLIVFMRATHSRRIFVQQLGRGLRTSPTKDRVVVLDFVTDLRRMAEVLELDAAVKQGSVERVGLGGRLVEFEDVSAGSFLREWVLDQADVLLHEDEAELTFPDFDFPSPLGGAGVQ